MKKFTRLIVKIVVYVCSLILLLNLLFPTFKNPYRGYYGREFVFFPDPYAYGTIDINLLIIQSSPLVLIIVGGLVFIRGQKRKNELDNKE